MSRFFRGTWTALILVALAAYVLVKGIVPALSAIDADFPGYFTSARIVIDGQDTGRLYDDDWFREQIRRYKLESAQNPGKFAPFPPPTALLLVPLARCEPLTALRILTAVSVLCLIGSIFLLARILAWHPVDAGVYVLSSGVAILGTLRCGQPYIVVSTFCILGYWLYLKRRPWLAGACFGLFAPIKYFPVIFLIYFAWRRQWRVLLGGVGTIGGIALVSIGVLGWKVHQVFLLSVLGNHLMGRLSLRAAHTVPFTAVYQSIDTLFNRLFVFDPARNPQPLWAAPLLASIGIFVAKASILLVAVAALAKLARQGAVRAAAPSIGILGILLLLIAPATATYMCVLLWLPVALLINYLLMNGERASAYFVAACYVLIGFIPYRYTYPFEGRGGLTVLAYPRLFILLAMFAGCVWCIVYPRKSEQPAASAVPVPGR
ncbi:MAG TPA: glycosyltransferase family 87 protein [Steroidobacteraceae bacterium]|jgi:hypothetical protein